MFLFRKVFLTLVFMVVAAVMSGCAVVMGGAMLSVSESSAKDLAGVVEVGEVKYKSGANIATIKTAKVLSVISQKDMTTPVTSPDKDKRAVNTAIFEEIKRSFGISVAPSPDVVINTKTFYDDGINAWGFSYYYYGNFTERETLDFSQRLGIRKLINTHFLIEQGGNTLLEIRGLWAGGDNSDEIAGARQLARELANAVLKKLNSLASQRVSTTEAKKD